MKYLAEFNSIDSRAYRIEIETRGAAGTQSVKLGGTPFTASVKADGKNIYAPILCGGATVGLLSQNYIFDLYSGQAQGVKVTLYEETQAGDLVRWVGYGCPTIYDQGYDDYYEDINLDCVDGVAVLKDIPFRNQDKGIQTFLEIIWHCLKQSGCYRNFYISDNVQLEETGTESVVESLKISTANFFDDRKDVNQTDDDLAWSCYDVLYQLLQWLGYTLAIKGDEVFIMDWDSVAKGTAGYFRYSLEGEEPGKGIHCSLSSKKSITGGDYAGSSARLSLDEIYNKVTIKDEFHTYDNLFPTFGDDAYETNLTADRDIPLEENEWSGAYFGDVIKADKEKGIPENFIVYFVESYKVFRTTHLCVFKLMDSPVFQFHKYERASTRKDITEEEKWKEGYAKFSDMLKTNGAFYLRYCNLTTDKTPGLLQVLANLRSSSSRPDWKRYEDYTSEEKLKALAEITGTTTDANKISLSSLIVMVNTGEYRFGPCDEVNYNDQTGTADDITKKYPFITLKNQLSSSIFGGVNHFLRIKGKISYHSIPDVPFPLDLNETPEFDYDGDKKYGHQGYIWAKVKWGEQWWNGEDWETFDCWFKLYFWDPETTPGTWKNAEHYGKEFDIISNMKSTGLYLGQDGYIIPCPVSGNLEGSPEVAFTTRDMEGDSRRSHWHPKGTKMDNFSCRYFSEIVTIRDLSITAEVLPGLLSDADLNSKTCYTNVIENGSVSSMPDISFKVCTDDGKKPSYSSVALETGFVAATYNRALFSLEKGTRGTDGVDGALRQEEHMVFKLASHYENPKVVFKCNLHNEDFMPFTVFSDASFGDRNFILTEYETDYRDNLIALSITEKE